MYVLEKHINADGKSPLYFFSGTSTDTEPSGDWLTENSQLRQNDTGVKKYYHNGAWVEMVLPGSGSSLPENFPTEDAENAGKFIGFDANGDYEAKNAPESGDSLPSMTGKNGKVLGVTLNANDEEQKEWVDKDDRFTTTFTNNQGTWEADKSISDIISAWQAGKICDCVVVLAQDTYGLGILADVVVAENSVVFNSILALEGPQVALLQGFIVGATDVWLDPMIRDVVPAYTVDDIGKFLGVVSDGDGGAKTVWATPP